MGPLCERAQLGPRDGKTKQSPGRTTNFQLISIDLKADAKGTFFMEKKIVENG